MQEEITDKTINLCITAGRITAGVLKLAMRKFLNDHERKVNLKAQRKNAVKTEKKKVRVRAKEEKRLENRKPRGKMTMKQLVSKDDQLSTIPITDENIKSFDKVARKYSIDYTLKKDSSTDPPRYMVFFRAKDVDVMTQAFREYAGVSLKTKTKKPSVKQKLAKKAQEKINHRQRTRQKQKVRGQER